MSNREIMNVEVARRDEEKVRFSDLILISAHSYR